jgi:peptide/nickel transport system permease protein
VPTDTLPSQYLVVLKDKVQILYHTTAPDDIKTALKTLRATADTSRFYTIKAIISDLIVHYETLEPSATRWKTYIPVIFFNGSNNQYHTWVKNFLQGDFGISYNSKRPVYDELRDMIFWTMLSTGISLFLVYILAIPLGVYSARRRGTAIDSIISTILFAIHSIPNFWTGTLLIIFFCQPAFLNWFPPYGLGDATVAEDGWGVTISTVGYHLVLPVFCLTYTGLAFLSRQMRSAMLESLRQDYIRTAWAKGASESSIAWKHAFRNSLLPMITLFATVFPHLIAGSFVVETIFTLPGMGRPILTAIMSHDYPIVFTIVTLTSILAMTGNLVADVLYAVFDPRIRFDSN